MHKKGSRRAAAAASFLWMLYKALSGQFDLDALGGIVLDGGGAVGVALQADGQDTGGGGEGALGPFQIAQIGLEHDLFAAGGGDVDAQHTLGQEGHGAAGPAVAEAVAEALVAEIAEVTVQVDLALRHQS